MYPNQYLVSWNRSIDFNDCSSNHSPSRKIPWDAIVDCLLLISTRFGYYRAPVSYSNPTFPSAFPPLNSAFSRNTGWKIINSERLVLRYIFSTNQNENRVKKKGTGYVFQFFDLLYMVSSKSLNQQESKEISTFTKDAQRVKWHDSLFLVTSRIGAAAGVRRQSEDSK